MPENNTTPWSVTPTGVPSRTARVLPFLAATLSALLLVLTLPLTQRFFLPPPETIKELTEFSRRQPPPEEPVQYDVVYHRDLLRRYHLDVYGPLPSSTDESGGNPEPALTAAPPVIVFYHGGSWLRGDKITIRVISRFLRRMRQEGWYVVSVNYTTSLLRGLGGPVKLAERAYRWVVKEAPRYGWDPRRIGLWGISSGGHVALMTTTSLTEDLADHRNTPVPSFVLAECAPTDLIAMRNGDAFENSGSFRFFPAARLKTLSPLYRLSPELAPEMPPVLLFHGDADETVHVNQSIAYTRTLNAHGGSPTLLIWPKGNHAFLNYTDDQWYQQETEALTWIRHIWKKIENREPT